MDIVSWLLSRKYTDASILGIGGALAGKNCTIYSSTKSGNTTTIVFKWTADDGTERTTEIQVEDGETPTITSTEIEGGHTITFATTDPSQSVSFNVMDGLEGQRGVSVIRADVDNNNYLKLELSDGNIINAGQIKTVSMVDNTLSLESANPVENRVITSALNNKVNKVSGKQLSTEDFTTAEKNKLANIENGAQVNTLENLIINGEEATIVDKKIALNIITSAVSNLQNYYLKSETYTKQEVEELIGSTVGVTIEIVQALPTVGQTNVIYFLPTETANVYSQYIYTSADGWVLIGSTSVDLSNYYTKGQVDTLLNGKQNVLTIDAFPTAMSNNPVASGGVYSAIAQMQPQFQFTNMPVASESNYGFVYQYVGNAGTYEPNMFYRCVYNTYAGEYKWEEVIFHATVTVDSELSSTSTNPVQNKVVKEALDAKQDIMQFSTMPSAQDNLGKIVQYTGATTATYQNACFYKAVYDSEHDVYVWTMVKFSADISVDNVLSDVSENPVQNKVITNKFGEYKTAFTGTEEEWNALTSEEQNVYDIINITNDGDVLNLGIYLEKKTAMPVASEDVENRIYLYTGTTTQNYKKGVVYQCVSDGQDPATYSWVALIDFGTAAIKNSTDRVSPNNTDLVESQSVYSAINTALSSIYTPRGEITCAELTSELLISDNIGNVYETSDSGTTTALFLQGAGHPIAVGSNVGVINAGQGRILFNMMANAFDLTSYQKKDLTSAVEGATTVEGALGALSTDKQPKDLTTTVESATTVEGALGALSTNKQAKTLTTSVESQTTVEGALGALSTNKATQAEVNDIVNVLGAKNVLPFPYYTGSGTYNGVTITDNGDGSITLDGTCTGMSFFIFYGGRYSLAPTTFVKKNEDYIATLEVVSGSMAINSGTSKFVFRNYITNATSPFVDIFYEDNVIDTRSVKFTYEPTASYDTSLVWYEFNVGTTFNNWRIRPMLRLASITDDTYEPYAKTNQQLTKETSGMLENIHNNGAINLAPSKAESKTLHYITYTVGSDGVIDANGTSDTNTSDYVIFSNVTFKAGKYIIFGTGTDNIRVQITDYPITSELTVAGANNGVLTLNSDTAICMRVSQFNGQAINHVKIYPMMVDADFPLSGNNAIDYVPYAMSNKELTEVIPSDASASNKLVTKANTIQRYDLTASANTLAAVKTALETFYTSSSATLRTPYCGYITASGAVWWYEFEKVDSNYGYGELRYYDVDNTWYTFRVGTGVFTYQPVLNAELLSASNTFTPSSDYEILDWSVYQLGSHVWGTFILHKTSGDIPAGQTEVGNFSSTIRNAVNSVCFCSNNRYGGGAFYTGYLFIDQTGKMLMGNPSGTTTGINHAKISIDFCLT